MSFGLTVNWTKNFLLQATNNGSSESERHHYEVHNSNGGGGGEEITESDRNRLLYDYYVNPVSRYHGKRDFDEIDRWGFDKRNFDEIDRFGFNKRMSRRPHQQQNKRNMDEIDRYGLSGFR